MHTRLPGRWVLLGMVGLCLGGIASARAADSPRDALKKALDPFIDVFARSPDGSNHALSLRLRLAESSNQPPELQGSALAFRAQSPDRAFFQFAAVGTIVTIGRQGEKVWVAPASKLRPYLERASQETPTKADTAPLSPLRLKLPKALFYLASYLVGVRDAGTATVDGVTYRKIDIDPPDEKPGKDKYIRFWVMTDQGRLARMEWRDGETHGSLVIEEAKLSASLPGEAFQPEAAQREDMMELPVPRFRQLMRLVNKEEEKRAKAQVEEQRKAKG